jgi:hypothetical protein
MNIVEVGRMTGGVTEEGGGTEGVGGVVTGGVTWQGGLVVVRGEPPHVGVMGEAPRMGVVTKVYNIMAEKGTTLRIEISS